MRKRPRAAIVTPGTAEIRRPRQTGCSSMGREKWGRVAAKRGVECGPRSRGSGLRSSNHLVRKGVIGDGAGRLRIVSDDRLAFDFRLREPQILVDHGVEDLVAKPLANLGGN